MPTQEAEQTSSRETHEEISLLAYTLWQQRGCPDGSSEEDWLEAEREVLARSEQPVGALS